MADPSSGGDRGAANVEPAAYLDMPPDRRTLAKAHAALLAEAARRVVLDIPFQADVDDFRRVLIAEAKP
jgi:hypothetical protein